MWNESVLEPSALEDLKYLFGGDPLSVSVKYENNKNISRTPIIILSNYNILPKDAAFKTRVRFYEWRTYTHLISYKKKPYPLAFYHLLLKYNIFDKTNDFVNAFYTPTS